MHLYPEIETFLKHLYPNVPVSQKTVHYFKVQEQPSNVNSGVYAIAIATSFAFGLQPEKVKYNHNLMRQHLLQMFEENSEIKNFPQVPLTVPQFVFPLAISLSKNLANSQKCK